MIRDLLTHLHWEYLPVLSMFLFFSVFIGAVLWVYRKESKRIYEELGALPLESENT